MDSIFSRYNVTFAGIFGSRVRNENRPDSDLDVLVDFQTDTTTLLDLVRMERELSDAVGVHVDLVTEEALSPYIRDSVLHDLRIVYGKRPGTSQAHS